MIHLGSCSPLSSRGLGRGPFKAKTRVRIPVGAKYGARLKRLQQAFFALLARLYANVIPALPTRTTQERKARAHQENAERHAQIRQLHAEGMLLKELTALFGFSTGRHIKFVVLGSLTCRSVCVALTAAAV
jgi:hypothetical protein